MTPKQARRLSEAALRWKGVLVSQLQAAMYGQKVKWNFQTEYLTDMSDWINYCNMVIAGQYDKAAKFQHEMDTMPREKIPTTLYNLISTHG